MKTTIAALMFTLASLHSHAAPTPAQCLSLYTLAKNYMKARQHDMSLGYMLENAVENGVHTPMNKDILLRAYVAPLLNGEDPNSVKEDFSVEIFGLCDELFLKHGI